MSVRKGGQVIAGTPKITTGHHVGEIFWTSRLDNELNGAVDADGSVYSVEAFTGEQSVPALLRKESLPYVSLAEYESIVSANGFCRVWGWDGGDKFRVPTVKALLLTKEQAAVVGNGMTLGLTDGAATFGLQTNSSGTSLVGDAGAYGKTLPSGDGASTDIAGLKCVGITTNPEKSGIVSNLDVVEYRAMVQLATSVQEDATQLKEYKFNNPHFFGESKWTDVEPNNASWLLSNGNFHSGRTYVDYYEWLVGHIGETITANGGKIVTTNDEYTDYDWVINTVDETLRLPLKTKLASGSDVVGNGMTLGLTNGSNNYGAGTFDGSGIACTSNYGQKVSASGASLSGKIGESLGITTDPEKSGIETSSNGLKLYFYVGDTVQDPTLINAGEVLDYFSKIHTVHCVVDTFESGSSWYRVYDDGWVEQGATISLTACPQTITLLKQYQDNNYTICIGGGDPDSKASVCTTSVYSRAVGSFSLVSGFNGTFYSCVISWMACGYGA